MSIQAKILLDSMHPNGKDRLTTMEVTLHRFVLAEFNTHRAFSRNSASSRAIPVSKQLERVMSDPAIPVSFPREQKGMSGGEELESADLVWVRAEWLSARDYAVEQVQALQSWGVHKSVTNRLLEPFMWHTLIVSATDWENFWRLRLSQKAQPEIRVAAEAMKEAYDASTPAVLGYGDWHMPLVRAEDGPDELGTLKMISAARCARVSYLTHDGRRDIEADLQLAEQLAKAEEGAIHASPFEHVATPERYELSDRRTWPLGNFHGWRQFRHDVERSRL